MCNPTIMLAMTAFQAVSQVTSANAEARATKRIASDQQRVNEWNAKQQDMAAQDAMQRGSNEAAKIRDNARRANATVRAAAGSTGFLADSGSYGAVQENNDQVGAFDSLVTMNNAEREAYGFKSNAQNLRFQGQLGVNQAQYEAKAIKRNGLLAATGTLVKGFDSYGGDVFKTKQSSSKIKWNS